MYEGLDVSKGSVGVLFGVRYGDLESLGAGDLLGGCCYFVGDFQGSEVVLYILEWCSGLDQGGQGHVPGHPAYGLKVYVRLG